MVPLTSWHVDAGCQLGDQLGLFWGRPTVVLHVTSPYDFSQHDELRAVTLLTCSSRSSEMQKQKMLDLLKA